MIKRKYPTKLYVVKNKVLESENNLSFLIRLEQKSLQSLREFRRKSFSFSLSYVITLQSNGAVWLEALRKGLLRILCFG